MDSTVITDDGLGVTRAAGQRGTLASRHAMVRRVERLMKRTKQMASPLGDFPSGASLGGKASQYRDNQIIYKQGAPADTLFYIQEGGVRLTT